MDRPRAVSPRSRRVEKLHGLKEKVQRALAEQQHQHPPLPKKEASPRPSDEVSPMEGAPPRRQLSRTASAKPRFEPSGSSISAAPQAFQQLASYGGGMSTKPAKENRAGRASSFSSSSSSQQSQQQQQQFPPSPAKKTSATSVRCYSELLAETTEKTYSRRETSATHRVAAQREALEAEGLEHEQRRAVKEQYRSSKRSPLISSVDPDADSAQTAPRVGSSEDAATAPPPRAPPAPRTEVVGGPLGYGAAGLIPRGPAVISPRAQVLSPRLPRASNAKGTPPATAPQFPESGADPSPTTALRSAKHSLVPPPAPPRARGSSAGSNTSPPTNKGFPLRGSYDSGREFETGGVGTSTPGRASYHRPSLPPQEEEENIVYAGGNAASVAQPSYHYHRNSTVGGYAAPAGGGGGRSSPDAAAAAAATSAALARAHATEVAEEAKKQAEATAADLARRLEDALGREDELVRRLQRAAASQKQQQEALEEQAAALANAEQQQQVLQQQKRQWQQHQRQESPDAAAGTRSGFHSAGTSVSSSDSSTGVPSPKHSSSEAMSPQHSEVVAGYVAAAAAAKEEALEARQELLALQEESRKAAAASRRSVEVAEGKAEEALREVDHLRAQVAELEHAKAALNAREQQVEQQQWTMQQQLETQAAQLSEELAQGQSGLGANLKAAQNEAESANLKDCVQLSAKCGALEELIAELQRENARAATAKAAAEARAQDLASQLVDVRSDHLALARQHAEANGPAAAAGQEMARQQAVDAAVRECKRETKREANQQLAALEELRKQAEDDAADAHAALEAEQQALVAAHAAQERSAAVAAASGQREVELEASVHRLSDEVAQLRAANAVAMATSAAAATNSGAAPPSPRPLSPRSMSSSSLASSSSSSSSSGLRGRGPQNSSPNEHPPSAGPGSPEPQQRGRRNYRTSSMTDAHSNPDSTGDEQLSPRSNEPQAQSNKGSRWGDAINPAAPRHRSTSGSERPRKLDHEDGSWMKRSAFLPPADRTSGSGSGGSGGAQKDAARWRSDRAGHDPIGLLQPVSHDTRSSSSSSGGDAVGNSSSSNQGSGLENLLASVTLKPTDTTATGSPKHAPSTASEKRTSPSKENLPIAQVVLKPVNRSNSAASSSPAAPPSANAHASPTPMNNSAGPPAPQPSTESATPPPQLASPLLNANASTRPITPEKTRKISFKNLLLLQSVQARLSDLVRIRIFLQLHYLRIFYFTVENSSPSLTLRSCFFLACE